MKVFSNVKYTGMRVHPLSGYNCTCFEDSTGNDWYDERTKWEGGVIAVWPKEGNMIGSYSPIAIEYIPVDGQTLYEVDNSTVPEKDPMKLLGLYNFDGKKFTKRTIESVTLVASPPTRTKEDILADLERLKAELLSL